MYHNNKAGQADLTDRGTNRHNVSGLGGVENRKQISKKFINKNHQFNTGSKNNCSVVLKGV